MNAKDKKPKTWTDAKPYDLPQPTYTPLLMTLGVIFLLWGIPTTRYVTMLGGILFLIALVRWINLLRHE